MGENGLDGTGGPRVYIELVSTSCMDCVGHASKDSVGPSVQGACRPRNQEMLRIHIFFRRCRPRNQEINRLGVQETSRLSIQITVQAS